MRHPHRFWTLALVVLVVLACAARSGDAGSAPPHITAIQPDSGPAGSAYPIQATLTGTGFDSAGNTVRFGPIAVPERSSAAGGTVITFPVPKEIPSRGEVPPMVLDAGQYEVTVTTRAGTSNTVTFTLTRGP